MTVLTDTPALAVVPAPRAEVTVSVTGALDVTTLPRVREQLEQALASRPAGLAVDLSGCTFVDASALAVLLDVHRRMSRTGSVLTLLGCCPRVLRLLSLTGLRRVFALA
jgi:anti-sigma B factor antagonist